MKGTSSYMVEVVTSNVIFITLEKVDFFSRIPQYLKGKEQLAKINEVVEMHSSIFYPRVQLT